MKIPRPPVRLKMVLLVLVLFLSYSQLILVQHLWQGGGSRSGTDEVSLYEQRFAELKPLLPDRGIVGYVSDTGTQHFFETQYVLAPVLLDRSPGPKAIVANFSRDSARPVLLYGRPYRVLRDWHNGLAWLVQDSP